MKDITISKELWEEVLHNMENLHDMAEEHLPNYSTNNRIAEINDMWKKLEDMNLYKNIPVYDSKRAIELFHEDHPRGVDLVYIDYNDSLSDEQCAKIINSGDMFAPEEDMWDWINDAQCDSTAEIIKELANNNPELEEFLEEMREDDDLREHILEADKSTVMKDLLRNTRKVAMYYDLDYESCYSLSEDSLEEEIKGIAEHLHIDPIEHRASLKELVENATYGGNLCVYWYGDLEDIVIYGDEDDKYISFDDPVHLCIMDRFNGSGHDVKLKAKITAEFKRENLHMDKVEGHGYSYGYDVCGLSMDYYEDSPRFPKVIEDETKLIKVS